MKLDFVPKTGAYTLWVPRSTGLDVKELMLDHGLDLSASASTSDTACLFTREPYAAATFRDHATPEARARLGNLISEIDASWRSEGHAHIKCPPDQELWPFQIADLEYALRRTNTLVADQPGLGKTPVAICYANEISAKRVLVVCPANIRLQWCKRIREWTTMRWPYIVYPILHGRAGVHPQANWTVVSYDLIRTEAVGKAIARGTYDLLIIDEAHYLKTIDSERTHAIFGDLATGWMRKPIREGKDIVGYDRWFPAIASRCGSILALTGTPLPNRPREAYTIARNLNWDSIDWMSYDHFAERFNPSMKVERVNPETGKTSFYIDERTGRHAELQNRLRGNFMTRHLKRDVMPQLKLPLLDIIMMEETGPVKQALQAESLLDIDPETLDIKNVEVMGHVAVVRRMMGIALAPQVADYVDMLLDGGEEKVVVFGWHIEVLNILQQRLAKHGVIRIDGSVAPGKKQLLVDIFCGDRSKRVLLGNLQSVGTGTDGLQTVASHAVFAECSWTPGENEQGIDRLDRGLQTQTVQADFLVAPNSIAEKILANALRKRQTTHKALDKRI